MYEEEFVDVHAGDKLIVKGAEELDGLSGVVGGMLRFAGHEVTVKEVTGKRGLYIEEDPEGYYWFPWCFDFDRGAEEMGQIDIDGFYM